MKTMTFHLIELLVYELVLFSVAYENNGFKIIKKLVRQTGHPSKLHNMPYHHKYDSDSFHLVEVRYSITYTILPYFFNCRLYKIDTTGYAHDTN